MNNPYYLGVVATALASAISQILLNVSARKTYPSRLREYLNPYVISSYGILAGSVRIGMRVGHGLVFFQVDDEGERGYAPHERDCRIFAYRRHGVS